MRQWMRLKKATATAAIMIGALVFAAIVLKSESGKSQGTNTAGEARGSAASHDPGTSLELSPSQLSAIKIEPVGNHMFPVEKETIGSISFADDLSVQVFPSYQGKIIKSLVELGDQVQKGQPLYTIESPDLIQAESTLIGAAATLELTSKELARAKDLNGTNGVSERELEQATSDQQTAEGDAYICRDVGE